MPRKKGTSSIVNPLSGRKIQVGGRTHKKLLRVIDTIDEALLPTDQRGGKGKKAPSAAGATVKKNAKNMEDFYEELLAKTKMVKEPEPTAAGARTDGGDSINIPKSKYQLISSALPPDPEQHSWYHHHAPFSQNFGDYVCLKKSTLRELGMFLKDSLVSDIIT
jgi:hypothetical protein